MTEDQDKQDRIIRGNEAATILRSPLMVEVMSAFRRETLEELTKVDPTDTEEIHRLQATVSVIDRLREDLSAFVADAEDLSREKQSYP
jgi:hypothetical protein